MRLLSFAFSFLLIACACNTNQGADHQDARNEDNIPPIPFTIYKSSDAQETGKTYMPTGFYYLTEDEGVKMLKEHSDKVYNLNLYPFVSVNNIASAILVTEPLQKGTSASLKLVLDSTGTRALAEGSGNPHYPYIATVVANKLLYVVKNASKLKTSGMSISLIGYSEPEMNEMVKAIYQKK